VPRLITDEVIKAFVKKCKERHAIAFMQWRLYYSKSLTHKCDIKDIIRDRLEFMVKSFTRRKEFILYQDTYDYS